MNRLIAAIAMTLLLASGSAASKTLRSASQGDFQTADPCPQNELLTNLRSQQVHDTLVSRDKELSIVPGLATSWSQPSPLVWRFHPRSGVTFNDGTALTADDVVFSLERASHASPTGGITPSILASNACAEKRLPRALNEAKRLLAEAGRPNGFEVTLDCPNNRCINDEKICLAVAAMLAKAGIQTGVSVQPRATCFPKLEKLDTSFYLLGWGGAITGAPTALSPVLRSFNPKTGNGSFNCGRCVSPKLDALFDAAAVEMNVDQRADIIQQAPAGHNAQVHHVPLHRQVIPWAMRASVRAVHRADDWLMGEWMRSD